MRTISTKQSEVEKKWILIDATDVIVHIFHPEKRKFYDLEKMWSEPILKERINL